MAGKRKSRHCSSSVGEKDLRNDKPANKHKQSVSKQASNTHVCERRNPPERRPRHLPPRKTYRTPRSAKRWILAILLAGFVRSRVVASLRVVQGLFCVFVNHKRNNSTTTQQCDYDVTRRRDSTRDRSHEKTRVDFHFFVPRTARSSGGSHPPVYWLTSARIS